MKKTQAALVLKRLRKLFSGRTAYSGTQVTPFRVLVGTALSARTTDKTTERVAAALFEKYPTPEKLANAPIKTLEKILRPIGFFRTKAKNTKTLAQKLVRDFGGHVPSTLEELDTLPGVGRKTASCVLNYAFSKPAIAVDVHVHRITNGLKLVKTKTPEQTESALKEIYPKSQWRHVNNTFVLFGQNICLPRNPKCRICPLNDLCPMRRESSDLTLEVRFEQSQKIIRNSWRFEENKKP